MLKTLALRGFRGFESCSLNDLATVNLIVGKNDCGKTTVLEAVYLLATDGDPEAFYHIAARRNQLNQRMLSLTSGRPIFEVSVSPLLYGHACHPGSRFELSSEDAYRELSTKILSLNEIDGAELRDVRRTAAQQRGLYTEADPAYVLRLTSGYTEDGPVYPVAKDGVVLDERWHGSIPRATPSSSFPVRFLGLESVASGGMEDVWDEVLAEGREDEIVRDMRLLVPDVDTIHFQTGGTLRRDGSILIGRRDGGRRIPITSYGDGLRRLLALRLALFGLENGFLLIDEIDAGMHWTVMEDVWRLIVEVARKSHVQIFATTHSYDCIRGLGSLMKSRPDLAAEVSLQKVHRSLEQAVSFAGDQIATAVEQQIELR